MILPFGGLSAKGTTSILMLPLLTCYLPGLIIIKVKSQSIINIERAIAGEIILEVLCLRLQS